jgi:very-short-patch-repair endonuclease
MEKNGEITAYINTHPVYRNFIENLPYNIKLRARSRALRKAGVLSEVIFWLQVHKGIFWKIDFDRQRIIGNYIVDFYVKTLGLVIEIDGSSHDNKEDYDQKREDYLIALGLKIYRISDLRVKHDLSNVMMELENYIVAEFGNKMTPI